MTGHFRGYPVRLVRRQFHEATREGHGRRPPGHFQSLSLFLAPIGRPEDKTESIDRFVCNEQTVEISREASRLLKQRIKTADEGRLVFAGEARRRINKWLQSP